MNGKLGPEIELGGSNGQNWSVNVCAENDGLRFAKTVLGPVKDISLEWLAAAARVLFSQAVQAARLGLTDRPPELNILDVVAGNVVRATPDWVDRS